MITGGGVVMVDVEVDVVAACDEEGGDVRMDRVVVVESMVARVIADRRSMMVGLLLLFSLGWRVLSSRDDDSNRVVD